MDDKDDDDASAENGDDKDDDEEEDDTPNQVQDGGNELSPPKVASAKPSPAKGTPVAMNGVPEGVAA
jgi:hypothetical protein